MDKEIGQILRYIFRLLIVDNKSPKQVQFILGTSEPITKITVDYDTFEYNNEMYIWEKIDEKGEDWGKENGRSE